MNLSFWEKETFFKDIDIAIIGSGIVGLCAAIELKKANSLLNISIFERGFLPSGASTKNAGFACFGSVSEIAKDFEQYTENEVYSLIEKRWKGLLKLKALVGESNLGYENCGGFEIFENEKLLEKYADFIPILNKNLNEIIGKNTYEIKSEKIKEFGFSGVKHLIFNNYEGLVNTGLMMSSLLIIAKDLGVNFFNGITIAKIEDNFFETSLFLDDSTFFNVKKVLVTTNAFARTLLPELALVPGRGQVIVTKPIKNLRIKGAFHYDAGYFYFRNVGNRILLGGGRNLDFKAEETTEFGETEIVQAELKRLLNEVILPNQTYEIDYGWSGIMAFGEQQSPIVMQIRSNVYCAVKCQGMGVALGALVGEEAANLILESM